MRVGKGHGARGRESAGFDPCVHATYLSQSHQPRSRSSATEHAGFDEGASAGRFIKALWFVYVEQGGCEASALVRQVDFR
jgi:hypothetical protein